VKNTRFTQKDSTGGHATTGDSSGGDRKIAIGLDPRYIRPNYHCQLCGVTMPDNQKTSHLSTAEHKHNAAMRLSEAELQSAQAQAARDKAAMERSIAAARLIQTGFRSRRN